MKTTNALHFPLVKYRQKIVTLFACFVVVVVVFVFVIQLLLTLYFCF